MNHTNALTLGCLGLVSGLASFYLVEVTSSDQLIFYVPGLIFSLCIVGYMLIVLESTHIHWWRIILWIGISTLAYYMAVQTAIAMTVSMVFKNTEGIPFFTAGMVGGAVMLFGFFFLQRLTIVQFFLFTILGGLLGLAWFLGDQHLQESSSIASPLFSLYILWQGGMATALGYSIDVRIHGNNIQHI